MSFIGGKRPTHSQFVSFSRIDGSLWRYIYSDGSERMIRYSYDEDNDHLTEEEINDLPWPVFEIKYQKENPSQYDPNLDPDLNPDILF